jgi:hypothetical protein
MRKLNSSVLALLLLIWIADASAQNLMDLLEEEEEVKAEFATNTFFTTRVINGQSVENPYPNELIFVISHHFGQINQGAYQFWGLDQATIRLGFDYGVNDRLALSIGRSSYEKTYDGFLKYKLLRQQTGLKEVPLTVSWFSGIYIKSQRFDCPEIFAQYELTNHPCLGS